MRRIRRHIRTFSIFERFESSEESAKYAHFYFNTDPSQLYLWVLFDDFSNYTQQCCRRDNHVKLICTVVMFIWRFGCKYRSNTHIFIVDAVNLIFLLQFSRITGKRSKWNGA